MPNRSERSKKTKFKKKAIGKSKRVFVKGKTGKHHCALCTRVLHGVPHGKTPAQVLVRSARWAHLPRPHTAAAATARW